MEVIVSLLQGFLYKTLIMEVTVSLLQGFYIEPLIMEVIVSLLQRILYRTFDNGGNCFIITRDFIQNF